MKLLIPIILILFCLINCKKEVRVTSEYDRLDIKGTWSEYDQNKIEWEKARAKFTKWSAYQGEMDWEQAKSKCASLGMILPTKKELKTAYEEKVTESWKKEGVWYWSSEGTSFGGAYTFNVDTGTSSMYPEKFLVEHLRCIQPEPSSDRFGIYHGIMELGQARSRCANLGMRLPTMEEFKDAYKAGVTESWKTDWLGSYTTFYWSEVVKVTTASIQVTTLPFDVQTGNVIYAKFESMHVRCIR